MPDVKAHFDCCYDACSSKWLYSVLTTEIGPYVKTWTADDGVGMSADVYVSETLFCKSSENFSESS